MHGTQCALFKGFPAKRQRNNRSSYKIGNGGSGSAAQIGTKLLSSYGYKYGPITLGYAKQKYEQEEIKDRDAISSEEKGTG